MLLSNLAIAFFPEAELIQFPEECPGGLNKMKFTRLRMYMKDRNFCHGTGRLSIALR